MQNKWVNLEPENAPAPRTDHSLIRYFNKFYVYGGRDETHIFSDMHQYTIGSNKWTPIEAKKFDFENDEQMAIVKEELMIP